MKTLISGVIFVLAGCAAVQPVVYKEPKELIKSNNNLITINKPYDDAWRSLIEYSSKSFFSIKNFEKDSGLLTLTFGISDPGKYVDCGEVVARHINFEGPYLNAVQSTGVVDLDGVMNLFVKPQTDNSTTVIVSTRYILNVKDGDLPKQTWSFDAGGSAARKTGDLTITCRSTFKAETDIISGINLISQK